MTSNSFVSHILDQLAELDNIGTRKMFGGFGFYKDGIFFAIIANNILYFKTNKSTSEEYKSLGSKPFTYERNGKIIALSYWKLTVEILEKRDLLEDFSRKAILVAVQAKKK